MNYLVPYDFTPITRAALDHALAITETSPGTIELLHIIEKESQMGDAKEKFASLLEELSPEVREIITTKVRSGSIFEDISKEASEGNAQLLIMGTHGAKGLQKIMGSHAIRVITSAKSPFLVTQSRGPKGGFDLIVLPVDLSKERMQIVRFASQVAKRFNSEVHLVCKPESDEFLKNKLNNNIKIVGDHFKKEGIAHKVSLLPGKHSMQKEVIQYGVTNNADLFAIGHFPESMLPAFDKFTQELITNEPEIPVLVINTEEVTGVRPAYAFIGI
jgi:nucleotide-binding universal stress UspA family protein